MVHAFYLKMDRTLGLKFKLCNRKRAQGLERKIEIKWILIFPIFFKIKVISTTAIRERRENEERTEQSYARFWRSRSSYELRTLFRRQLLRSTLSAVFKCLEHKLLISTLFHEIQNTFNDNRPAVIQSFSSSRISSNFGPLFICLDLHVRSSYRGYICLPDCKTSKPCSADILRDMHDANSLNVPFYVIR